MKKTTLIPTWLAADYHFPTAYSCRVPMSSMSSTRAMPAPGPATIRLALVRTGIELFGLERTRDDLFPVIRSAEVCIRPPERVAFSMQSVWAYKGTSRPQVKGDVVKSVVCREMAHASGCMTVYLRVPASHIDECHIALKSVAYWGQANSLACCVGVYPAAPQTGEIAVPLRSLSGSYPLQQFFACVVSEFRNTHVEWDDVMPVLRTDRVEAIRMDLYVWPMIIREQHRGGRILYRHALSG